MAEHTPGTLKIHEGEDYLLAYSPRADKDRAHDKNGSVFQMPHPGSEDLANAERLCAAWNAFEGIDDIPEGVSVKELAEASEPFLDGFDYDPGHSDLDSEQPITVPVNLGAWRKLCAALAPFSGQDINVAPAPSDEWQDIKTAPKDGTEFLVINMNQGGVRYLVRWNRVHDHWQSKGEIITHLLATHWTLLPKPPSAQAEGKA